MLDNLKKNDEKFYLEVLEEEIISQEKTLKLVSAIIKMLDDTKIFVDSETDKVMSDSAEATYLNVVEVLAEMDLEDERVENQIYKIFRKAKHFVSTDERKNYSRLVPAHLFKNQGNGFGGVLIDMFDLSKETKEKMIEDAKEKKRSR